MWGLVQGDRVSFLQELGFVAALGGSLMASFERGGTRPRFAAGAGWGVLAMLAFGGYYVPFHAAAQHDWLWPSLVFRVTSVTLIWSALLVSRARLGGVRPHLAVLAAVGVLDTGGNVFFAAASSTHGLLSVVSVLASLYPVATVLLARFALGERVRVLAERGRGDHARRRRDDLGRLSIATPGARHGAWHQGSRRLDEVAEPSHGGGRRRAEAIDDRRGVDEAERLGRPTVPA